MNKAFNNFTWENDPSVNTPLSADNLNTIGSALDIVDTRVVQHETTKANQTDMLTAITSVSFNEDTGIFTFTRYNGTSFTVDTKLEKIVLNYNFDSETQTLYLILEDGTEMPVDLSAFITNVEFEDSTTIRYSITDVGKVTFDIIDGSITGDKLEPNFLANAQMAADEAEKSESNASQSATEAEASAVRAEKAAEKAVGIVGGDFATNSRVDDIVNGTTKVGDSDKLDGHDSEYFASADNVKKNDLWTELTRDFDLNNAKGKYRTSSGDIVNSLLNKPTLAYAGGEVTVDWFPTEKYNLYGMQMLKHTNSSGACDIYIRYANNTTFTEWECIITNTGGTLSGDLKLVSSDTTKKVFQLKNSLRTINFIIYTDGTFRVEDATNNKKLVDSSSTGRTYIEGTASGNLPVDGGGIVNGQVNVKHASSIPLKVSNSDGSGQYALIGFYNTVDGELGSLGFYGKHTPTFYANGLGNFPLHHDGNSAKVVVSDTAPSDTSAVWFDTSEV